MHDDYEDDVYDPRRRAVAGAAQAGDTVALTPLLDFMHERYECTCSELGVYIALLADGQEVLDVVHEHGCERVLMRQAVSN